MQKTLFRFWIILWPLALCLLLFPINNFTLRIGLLVSLLGIWAGCLFFNRRKKRLCLALVFLPLCVAGFLIFPGRPADKNQLRATYVTTLRSYEGTRYIWGGENVFGIDCSGLVRAGLIKANFREGLVALNPRLIRFALSLWWHDSSAEALGHEYRKLTKLLSEGINLNQVDQNQILPGDIAVTVSGVHVMAYLGEGKWIEADPNIGKTVIVQVPESKNPWFQETFKILRWRELDME